MAQRGVLRTQEGHRLAFWCPGCREAHAVVVAPHPHPWGFNGNFDLPTFTPSVLVSGTVPITEDQHARIMRGERIEPKPRICHSFVTDGNIQFLDDCTHELANQTVRLQPFE